MEIEDIDERFCKVEKSLKEVEKKSKNRFEKVEKRVERLEKLKNKRKLSKGGYLLKCDKCGYSWVTLSESILVSCTNCGSKVTNPEKEKEKYVPFKGKRYEDYDSKFNKDIIFKNQKFSKCDQCKKKVDYDSSFYGYNRLLCKKCYIRLDKSNHEAVEKMGRRL